MSILQKKFRLPDNHIMLKKANKVLFLNPSAPDWIVVTKNGAAILKLCNGKRTVKDISNALSVSWAKISKEDIVSFFANIDSNTTFLSPPNVKSPIYQPAKLHIVQISLVSECNLSCIYCYATDRAKGLKKLSRKDHFHLIDDINELFGKIEIEKWGQVYY